jgi:hypothetical protein
VASSGFDAAALGLQRPLAESFLDSVPTGFGEGNTAAEEPSQALPQPFTGAASGQEVAGAGAIDRETTTTIDRETAVSNGTGLCVYGRPAGLGMSFTGQKVAASIAVHPPRFYAIVQLLEEYVSCPAAVSALGLFLVFSSEQDVELFRAAAQCLNPAVPHNAYTPVVVRAPKAGWKKPSGFENQFIAAYKKWYGIAHMMDLASDVPEYGMMLDAELLLYEKHAPESHLKGCGKGSAWTELLGRIRRVEAKKEWVAARVSETLKIYKFGNDLKSGKMFDQLLIAGNANFITKGVWKVEMGKTGTEPMTCYKGRNNTEPECLEIRRQYEDGLFTWWTDIPWMNLTVAGRMVKHLLPDTDAVLEMKDPDSYREMATHIRFQRFEHIHYQQWAVLNEGFHFRDVTNLTGEAKWGSYLEDPMPGTRLQELAPMWTSGQAVERAEKGTIVGPPADEPPLLIFHSDHGNPRKNFMPKRKLLKKQWGLVCEEVLKQQGRDDWNAKDIER